MQYYFNNLEPIDNNTTPDECASIELMLYPNFVNYLACAVRVKSKSVNYHQ